MLQIGDLDAEIKKIDNTTFFYAFCTPLSEFKNETQPMCTLRKQLHLKKAGNGLFIEQIQTKTLLNIRIEAGVMLLLLFGINRKQTAPHPSKPKVSQSTLFFYYE